MTNRFNPLHSYDDSMTVALAPRPGAARKMPEKLEMATGIENS
jgi:hypothetical protein